MLRLLNIELHKIRFHRGSKFLIISYFALLTSLALIASIKFEVGPVKFYLAEQGIFNFPYIWHLNTYLAAILKIFFMLVIVSMMSNEYSFNTLKQNLIDGLSKKEFVLSKFYTVVLFALISTLFVGITTLILGLIYSDFTEFTIVTSDLKYLLAYFIKLVAFFSFGLFLGVLIKRSAFAIGALIIWAILEAIFIGLMRWNWKWDNYETIAQFLPLNAMTNLIKEPFTRFNAVKTVAHQIGETVQKDFSVHFADVIIVSVWTALFIYFTYAILKKRDL
jgi:ABC-type transport system involved in multi-copper enzyme maturation permease subunit